MRISRHQMFMEIAHVVAKRSTCFRENVGAILVKENKVVSIGYNGAPSGHDHCTYHPHGRCAEAIHAEINALSFLENNHEDNIDLYVTHLPCLHCTASIIMSKCVKNVFFSTVYGDSQKVYELLDESHIKLLRILPSGDITSHDRSEIYNDFK